MRLEHYPAEKLKKQIFDIVSKHLDTSKYRAFFFGSRVGGGGTEHSDIDIGIEGPEEVQAEALAAIEEGIESIPVLYKIEVVDFKRVAPMFREVALQHTEFL